MIPLTPRQLDAFNFIATYIAREGVSPTYREIGEAIGVSTEAAFSRVQGLVERGWVTRSSRRQSIEIVDNTLPTHEEWDRITEAAMEKVGCDERTARVVMMAIGGKR